MFKLKTVPLLTGALLLTACGSSATDRATETTTSSATDSAPSSATTGATEVSGAEPRLALTYDGGILVLDAESGEVLDDAPLEGFTRLSPAGDDRHLFVSATGGFTALDLGTWTEAHGDHGHSWTAEPTLTDLTIAAEAPGHVVPHDGTTALFDDATGTITLLDPAELAEGTPETETTTTEEAHHGVAFRDERGNLVTTVGNEDSRDGIAVLTAAGNELARTDDCPGVHGEAFGGERAVFGCEDGVLVLDGTEITKVDAPDDYGRIGNQAGHAASPFVLGDYKVDADAELERPTRVSVIDTRDASLRLVDLPASYSFRSLGRTPDGDGLVLGTDGRLRVIDVADASVRDAVAVTEEWREPMDWQEPRPTLLVLGDTAYVTEPATDQLHVVDLADLSVTDTHDLPHTPNELNGVTG
ncbi:hypothetical protein KUV85_08665 [Nocardioides panacisoli]|uniref:zinc metallochaperone AztD n=1 Tax=Nocardioides panacisoli TaxID=627624 RepID=UPI001C636627|nr:zinc metallochaperone AztD [Nocardioides panacisoli]QYJ05735.1 hypothetical protein KUV85_08665 [Nocardioides panacisoli]